MKIARLLALFAILALSGCQGTVMTETADAAPGASSATPRPVEEYKIGVDDVVDVNVWKNPDLSVKVPVRPDGNISVPLIGDVLVGGKTPSDVSEIITQKLSAFLREPQVTVILSELRSHEFLSRVRITGAVAKPVSIPYRQGMTVLDAILEAGGVSKFASSDSTKLYRKDGTSSRVLDVSLNQILKQGDLRTNYALEPGDVITVPERAF
ncbi:MAG: XrtA/PEP-CTERM system exopolysaccharide export protein [Thiotrichales bacterium]